MILCVKCEKMLNSIICFKKAIQKTGMAENNKCQFMILVSLLCFLS